MAKRAQARRPLVDLGALLFPLLLVLTLAAPIGRGLFFAPERDTFTIAVAVLLLALALHLLLAGQGPIGRHWMDWAVLALALGYWLAYLLHPAVPAAALDGALRGGLYLAWYWLIAAVVRDRRRLVWYARTLYASGVLLALLGCLAAAGHFNFPGAVQGQRILSTLQYANAFGAMLDFTFIIGLALMVHAQLDPKRRRGSSAVPLGIYGAGNFLVVLTLLGTASRGAWLVLPVVLAIWWWGLARDSRGRGLLFILWPTALALLLSRPVLDAFWGHRGGAGLGVLAVGVVVSGAAGALYPTAVRAWARQRYPVEVRRALQALAGLYVVGVVGFLLLSTGRAAVALAGHGLVAGSVAARAAGISLKSPDLLQRVVMWRDALRLIPRAPLFGLGGGAWSALYHQVQSAPYWSTQVHESVLQAWLGGGLLAAAGLAAAGLGVLILGWRRRRDAGDGAMLLWGLGVAAFALFGHSLADFDLSLPALTLMLWGAAAALRRGSQPEEGAAQPRWWWGVAGLVGAGGVGLLLLLPAVRVTNAASAAGRGAVDAAAKQYARAYQYYNAALTREPLTGTYLADQAQLLLVAYAINHNGAELQQAADMAQSAQQYDPGNLTVSSVALGVLNQARHWQQEAQDAAGLIRSFPVDPEVYDYAGPAMVNAAEGEIQVGEYSAAGQALGQVTGMAAYLQGAYRSRAQGLARRFFAEPALGAGAQLAAGEASALLGHWNEAISRLTPLAHVGSGSIAAESRGWLAAVEQRSGERPPAADALGALRSNALGERAYLQAYQLTAFSGEVGHGG